MHFEVSVIVTFVWEYLLSVSVSACMGTQIDCEFHLSAVIWHLIRLCVTFQFTPTHSLTHSLPPSLPPSQAFTFLSFSLYYWPTTLASFPGLLHIQFLITCTVLQYTVAEIQYCETIRVVDIT